MRVNSKLSIMYHEAPGSEDNDKENTFGHFRCIKFQRNATHSYLVYQNFPCTKQEKRDTK